MFPVLYEDRGVMAPWSPLRVLERDVARFLRPWTGELETWLPSVDVRETEEAYTIEAELPGLKKEDVHIEVEDGVLFLRGERKLENEVKREGYRHIERRYGRFERSFEIPDGFNPDKVTANLENGILRVTLPKREDAKPKRVEVNVN